MSTGLRFGYGTNGFANHRLDDAVEIIAELGYTGIALTLDHHHLDPFAPDATAQARRLAGRLRELGLRVVVETGARYLLDPRAKHAPTLLDDEPGPRLDFLQRALEIASELGADCVSYWSGSKPVELPDERAWQRMLDGTGTVLTRAEQVGVPLGLEPEPGMFVERLADALRLRAELGEPSLLGITLDIGHCIAVETDSLADCIRQAGPLLVNVQLDDMRSGVHEHLEFGTGEVNLAEGFAALSEVDYRGVAAVELPRHSHAAPVVAARSMDALRAAWRQVSPHPWLAEAEQRVATELTAIRGLFPAVGRKVGRQPLRSAEDPAGLVYGTVDDLARRQLIGVLVRNHDAAEVAAELAELYRYGDDAERRGVLRGLAELGPEAGAAGLPIVADALRTNDTRLIAAALGPFAERELDQHSWRHGVLKCLFVGVPTEAVAGLDRRSDAELRRMVRDFAAERTAAGRQVPADARRLLEGSQ
ncbi:sugar phosphate isomerase/epimerase [Tamaricihabitans halophyticus]|uniref:Sugar phosphate isomerase/epimerase n=1 Tax=Tamaricihabitans halophyticus TaxID=1262583 RepID=A0A4R2R358_9PSEU|nr:EboA domain-containing protein [Tamaricihabitans halophyticus]TCP56109.1 sugar phosphate isomerase/epimerase [Tamaricihabitans halophyticus]